MSYKEINKKSLELNRKKYLSCFGINLIFCLIISVLSALILFSDRYIRPDITGLNNNTLSISIRMSVFLLVTVIACIFLSGISLGNTAVFTGRVCRKCSDIKRIVYWLKPSKSLKAFGLSFTVMTLKALWTSAFLIPGNIIAFTIVYLAFTGGIEIYLLLSLSISAATLIICGIIFSFILTQRYFLAKYLLAENPKLKILQVIRQSKNLMEYQLTDVVKFKLCYFLPLLLSVFILPIIFLYPHYKQSLSILAKELTV